MLSLFQSLIENRKQRTEDIEKRKENREQKRLQRRVDRSGHREIVKIFDCEDSVMPIYDNI